MGLDWDLDAVGVDGQLDLCREELANARARIERLRTLTQDMLFTVRGSDPTASIGGMRNTYTAARPKEDA